MFIAVQKKYISQAELSLVSSAESVNITIGERRESFKVRAKPVDLNLTLADRCKLYSGHARPRLSGYNDKVDTSL